MIQKLLAILVSVTALMGARAYADTAAQINTHANAALNRFVLNVKGAKKYLNAAKGILIIPEVKQAGLVVGGEYGEGCLRIGGKTSGYFSIISGSVGLQAGVQLKDIVLIFMSESALKKFNTSDNWQAGADGTVTLINEGEENSIDTTKFNHPIVGFVFGQKGLMAGAMIEGSKFTRIKK